MANVYAVKSGNWTDTTVWNTGSLPTSADNVYANGYTVTINTSPTVVSISNRSASGIVSGGLFEFYGNGLVLTCTAALSGIVGANMLYVSVSLPSQCSVVGSAKSTQSGQTAVHFTGSGTLNWTGIAEGGGGGAVTPGIRVYEGILNFVGDCISGSQGPGIYVQGTSIVNITGNITGSTASTSATYAGLYIGGDANVTVDGTVAMSSGYGISIGSLSGLTFKHTGAMYASATHPAFYSLAQGSSISLSGPFYTTSNSTSPLFAWNWRWITPTSPSFLQVRTNDLSSFRSLYTADSTDSESGQPAASNVRSGTVYGPNSELTGTCAVPAAGSVAFGVPVDATTGTAVLTPESVRSAVGLASANLDTQLSRLANAATTQEVADIVEGAAAQP